MRFRPVAPSHASASLAFCGLRRPAPTAHRGSWKDAWLGSPTATLSRPCLSYGDTITLDAQALRVDDGPVPPWEWRKRCSSALPTPRSCYSNVVLVVSDPRARPTGCGE